MERMSSTIESPIRDFGDSLQLTHWVLESGKKIHTTPDI